uniref:GTPase SAR1 family protein n=1 Tax=Candidatus Kentrum sp. MB TaxID=2138164 RepID=A0A450XAZ5_9GAMM|nr:MAG: GTPase SAR1 family protein [Candidatus Kentron sp. MB]
MKASGLASPVAFKLACFLAAAPLRLPIMRLVQQALVPESGQTHLAEFFLSGLIRRVDTEEAITDPDEIQYDFFSVALRDRLLNAGLVTDTIQVQEVVSDYVAEHYGGGIDFRAALLNPEAMGGIEIDVDGDPFARVTAHVLKKLGRAIPGSTHNSLLYRRKAATPTVYVNAKAVLLGDSGVGKSGLGIRMAEKAFHKTGSTHGAQFWHFSIEQLPGLPENVQAELTLWDLAGQPEHRLTHQLFLDDADAALLLFDCSDPNEPFRGVPYWAKVLRKQARKFLVSTRADLLPVTVDRHAIERALDTYGLDEYFKTSAHTGEGVDALFERLIAAIPWETLPRTRTLRLFQGIREFLLAQKADGVNLLPMKKLQQAAEDRLIEHTATQDELNTVVDLLQSRGLVHHLKPRVGESWILLKPERINQYGASIIQAARNHEEGIGAVAERDVLAGELSFSGFDRLPRGEEGIVLTATVELLIGHDLGFREMGYLVFPSQISVTRVPPTEIHPRTEVAYRFSGATETIYASLVVRLNYTDYFQLEDQWKYAVEFSRDGHRLGFSMKQIEEEGTGKLEIYFEPGVSESDRVTFIRFITDHLRARGVDIEEEIRLYCPNCGEEVTNHAAIGRVAAGKPDIPCQFCDTAIPIPRSVEELYRRDPKLDETQRQLVAAVEDRTKKEKAEFCADQRQYTAGEGKRLHILHLSDLHLTDEGATNVYRAQLETDLRQKLGIQRLAYLVISGDITDHATEKEYQAAFGMVDGLVKRFGLDASRVVVVPGNHDLNWDLSKKAYPFVYKNDLPSPPPESRHIPAGENGALVRDDEKYRQRFAPFNDHFYRYIYRGQGHYPLDEGDQFLFVERPKDRILFLGLNSCWEIDHHFRDRASIHMPALTNALGRLHDANGKYDGWLKIAVWHHPVTGRQMMDDGFMELLAIHGFQVCLHGHIHQAIEDYHKHDDRRGIHVVGAGTFGAPAREQVPGIPLQYNLLTFDPENGEMTVNTRKKEKPNGAWSADARWGDKNNPKPWYSFPVAGFRGSAEGA